MITRTLAIDTKNTIWYRSHIVIEGETEQEIQEEIDNFSFDNYDYDETYSEYIFDSVEDLPLTENQYNSTIELVEYTDKGYTTLKDNLSSIKKEDVKMFSINDISKLWNACYDEHFIEQYENFYKILLNEIE